MAENNKCGCIPKVYGDLILGVLHSIQGIIYIALGASLNRASIPVYITVPTGRPGNATTMYALSEVFIVSPIWLIGAFFLITGLFHFIRTGWCIPRQMTDAPKPRSVGPPSDDPKNMMIQGEQIRTWDRKVRWIEYSITSTLMIYTILLLSGISDFYAIAGCGAANVAMILFGFAGDLTDPLQPMYRVWTFVFGSIVGVAPWIFIFAQVGVIGARGISPGVLVYLITINIFTLFFSFAIAEFAYIMSYIGKGWTDKDKLARRNNVEIAYQILSAGTKTMLGVLTAAAVLTN